MPRLGNQKWFLPRYDGLLGFGFEPSSGLALAVALALAAASAAASALAAALAAAAAAASAARCASRSARQSAPAMRTSSRLTSSGSMAPPEARIGRAGMSKVCSAPGWAPEAVRRGAGRLVGGDAADEERLGDDEPRQAGGQAHREAAGGSLIHAPRLAARDLARSLARWSGGHGTVGLARSSGPSWDPTAPGLSDGRCRAECRGIGLVRSGDDADPDRWVRRDPGPGAATHRPDRPRRAAPRRVSGVRERQDSVAGCGPCRRPVGMPPSPATDARPRSRAASQLRCPAVAEGSIRADIDPRDRARRLAPRWPRRPPGRHRRSAAASAQRTLLRKWKR